LYVRSANLYVIHCWTGNQCGWWLGTGSLNNLTPLIKEQNNDGMRQPVCKTDSGLDQPSIGAEMQVHNGSSMTLHHCYVLTLTICVPQNYNIALCTQLNFTDATLPSSCYLGSNWLGSQPCDQQVAGSNPGRRAVECNPGQVVYTHTRASVTK